MGGTTQQMIWIILGISLATILGGGLSYIFLKQKISFVEEEIEKKKIESNILREQLAQLEVISNQNYIKFVDVMDDMALLQKRLIEEQEENRKILSQKKSSEVSLGNSWEVIAPIIDSFPYIKTYR